MVAKARGGGGVPWRLVAVLLGAALSLLWVCTQLALQPSCETEIARAARAEELVYRLQQQAGATRGEAEAQVEALQRHSHDLETALKEARERLVAAEAAATANSATAAGGAAPSVDERTHPESDALALRRPAAGGKITEEHLRSFASSGATAVVMIVCKRPKYLKRSMDSLFRAERDPERFPLIISQDAFDEDMTRHVESSYVETGKAFHMYHTHEANAPTLARKFGNSKQAQGYVFIAQHFGFALRRTFDDFGFGAVIFIEEDMEVAPDFFSYFGATLPLLRKDPDLFCVSAWNDNGYDTLVQDPKLAFRTDFFPGLGWMIDRGMWQEVRDRWAQAYWDEFMRRPDVRHNRHCIRPEVSRSFTFGEEGTSAGQFFKQHLSRIRLNTEHINWADQDLSRLASSSSFEAYLRDELRAAEATHLEQVDHARPGVTLRILYDDKLTYSAVAQKFGLMKDEKEGIRRMSYRGVIPFAWKGHRIYLYTDKWPGDLR